MIRKVIFLLIIILIALLIAIVLISFKHENNGDKNKYGGGGTIKIICSQDKLSDHKIIDELSLTEEKYKLVLNKFKVEQEAFIKNITEFIFGNTYMNYRHDNNLDAIAKANSVNNFNTEYKNIWNTDDRKNDYVYSLHDLNPSCKHMNFNEFINLLKKRRDDDLNVSMYDTYSIDENFSVTRIPANISFNGVKIKDVSE